MITPGIDSPTQTSAAESNPALPAASKKQPNLFREMLETALIAILIFVLIRSVVLNFQVSGESMLPSFQDGELVLVNRNAYQEFDLGDLVDWLPGVPDQHWSTVTDWGAPERGDVIVFTPPEPADQKPFIKRVIGLPGDHIQITDNNTVLVNGTALDEDYVGDYITTCPWDPTNCDITVADGTVFVMGDHRNDSEDSRFFGLVPEGRIIGKAWLVYWPTESIEIQDSPDYPELNP